MFRLILYISGIAGGLLLLLSLLGIFLEFQHNNIFLYTGLILIGFIFLLLLIIENYRYNKKINSIINSYRKKAEDKVEKKDETTQKGKTGRGWGLNNSPYRERKSGLSWGGGNVHAANAKRGGRRSFLKR